MNSLIANTEEQDSAELAQSAGPSGRGLDSVANRLSETLQRHKGAILAVFSIAYFALTFYRASRKLFWLDELFTLHLSRLPDLKSVWRALMNGTDFNPPLFYLLTHFSQHILGEGHIGTRLPAILGFWVFCLCLFRFISRRLSVLSACVSMLFPLVTGAYGYAYEARAHGIVLGFCGIALISWQAAADRTEQRWWWLLALSGSLACALLTHSYAFLVFTPIVLGELSRTATHKRLDLPVWMAIAAGSVAVLASIPFVYQAISVVQPFEFFSPNPHKLIIAYKDLLIPSVSVLVGWLVLMCLVPERKDGFRNERGLRSYEVVALCTLIAIPLFEYAAAKLTGAPFLTRYGLSAIAGFAGLLGVAVEKRSAVAIGTLAVIVGQIGVAFFGYASGSVLVEPSSNYQISTRIREFSERYEWMGEDKTLPIVLLDDLDFLPTAYYAPPSVASQLVYTVLGKYDINGGLYVRLRACCKSEPAVIGIRDFLESHDAFLVYGGPHSAYRLENLVKAGATVTTRRETRDHFLDLVIYPKKTAKESSR
jgi:hypothetical protein